MVNLKPQGYRGYIRSKKECMESLRNLSDVFDLEWLKWALLQPNIQANIKGAISHRIFEIENAN